LKIAHRRRIIGENVATLVDQPTVDEPEANPFTTEQAKAFLEAAVKRPTFMCDRGKPWGCDGPTSTSKPSCSTLSGSFSGSPVRAVLGGLPDPQELQARSSQDQEEYEPRTHPVTKRSSRGRTAVPSTHARTGRSSKTCSPKQKRFSTPI
jgi:hypothetical protein